MKSRASNPLNLIRLPRDGWFWLALLAGPLAWYALALLWKAPLPYHGGAWRLFLVALLYPLAEEWIFRGLLQPRLLELKSGACSMGGFTGANALTTAVFAAAHLYTHPPMWALLVVPPSLLFGWFRDRYASIFPGVLLHVFYNLGYFLLFAG